MCTDHRYPEEIKEDARRRVTLREHPELARLLRRYGTHDVLDAALMMQSRRWACDGPLA